MEEQNQHIDDLFREELGNYTEVPPASVWGALEKRLDGNNPRPRLLFRWGWYVLVLLVGSYYIIGQINNERTDMSPGKTKPVKVQDASAHLPPTTGTEQAPGSSAATPQNISAGRDTSFKSIKAQKLTGKETEPTVPERKKKRSGLSVHRSAPVMGNNAGASTKGTGMPQQAVGINEKKQSASSRQAAGSVDRPNVFADKHPEQNIPEATSDHGENKAGGPPPTTGASAGVAQHVSASPASVQPEKNTRKRKTAFLSVAAKTASGTQETKDPLSVKAAPDKKKNPTVVKGLDNPAQQLPVLENTPNTNHPATGLPDQGPGKKKPVVTVPEKTDDKEHPEMTARLQSEQKNVPVPEPVRKTSEAVPSDSTGQLQGATLQTVAGVVQKKDDWNEKAPEDPDYRLSHTPSDWHGIPVGLKIGYERGFASVTASKTVIAPFIEIGFLPRWSLVVQPAIKFGVVTGSTGLSDKSYYNILKNTRDSIPVIGPDTGRHSYYFLQNYDSIRVSVKLKTNRWLEFELPVLIRYKLTDQLGVMAGVNLNFGKVLQVEEARAATNITIRDSIVNTAEYYPVSYINGIVDHQTEPYTNYKAAANPASNPVRWGYMLGVNYQWKDRLTLEVMMQQTISGQTYITVEEVRKYYTQPYFRISVGYTIFRKKVRAHNTIL